jgi:hypothetical protein
MRPTFDWDPAKAQSNLAKHGVSFDEATAVFHDSLTRKFQSPGAGCDALKCLMETKDRHCRA